MPKSLYAAPPPTVARGGVSLTATQAVHASAGPSNLMSTLLSRLAAFGLTALLSARDGRDANSEAEAEAGEVCPAPRSGGDSRGEGVAAGSCSGDDVAGWPKPMFADAQSADHLNAESYNQVGQNKACGRCTHPSIRLSVRPSLGVPV
jgi:hypothetical protein